MVNAVLLHQQAGCGEGHAGRGGDRLGGHPYPYERIGRGQPARGRPNEVAIGQDANEAALRDDQRRVDAELVHLGRCVGEHVVRRDDERIGVNDIKHGCRPIRLHSCGFGTRPLYWMRFEAGGRKSLEILRPEVDLHRERVGRRRPLGGDFLARECRDKRA